MGRTRLGSSGVPSLKRWKGAAVLAGLLAALTVAVAMIPTILRQDVEGYEWQASWGGTGTAPGSFRGPIGIAVDGAGFVYVSDSGNDRIRLFRLDGTPAHTPQEDTVAPGGALDAPGGAARSPAGGLWIADFFNHPVVVYGLEGDAEGFRRQVGSAGRGLPGRLHYPTDIAFGPDGTAYVADAYNHRIQRFAADGGRLDGWGGPLGTGVPGPWKGWFSVATGVHVDDTGRVYVADFYNHRIQVFGPSGSFRGEWGEAGSGPGTFDRPTDVATGPDGRIYVVDFGNDRVQVFTCPGCDSR